jgi:aldehyde oxidoreductase
VAPPGTLEIRVIRSPFHRAGFTLGDLEGWAAATPGIAAVLTAADIPGDPHFGVIPAFADQPVFAVAETRFKGEAVAAVVATPQAMATFDPAVLPIAWEERPACLTPDAARGDEAPRLHPGRAGNVMCQGRVTCGAPEDALARADVVVEGRFVTSFVEHAYIEPEAGFARMVGDRLEVHACTQAPTMDREALAAILAMDEDRIRIVPTGVGGGFGSKLDLSVQPFLALAALKTGAAVRMAYDRAESMASTTKRHPADITARIGATRDGKLCGMVFDGTFNTGAYASWGPTVANRVPVHASGPYRIADYRARAVGVHTHTVPAGAFRGFGVPQSAVAQESLLDDAGRPAGIDRLAFRIANALDNDMPTVCGQVFESGVGIKACLEALRRHGPTSGQANSTTAAHPGRRRGVGVAGAGMAAATPRCPTPRPSRPGSGPTGWCCIRARWISARGQTPSLRRSSPRGARRAARRADPRGADTDVTPDAGKTSASRQTFVTGNAARLAGEALRARCCAAPMRARRRKSAFGGRAAVSIRDGAAEHRIALAICPPTPRATSCVPRKPMTRRPAPLDANGQGAPYAQFGYAAHLAEVEVDLGLGTVRPVRIVAAHDVGRAINPLLVEGQVHGGVAQGLGMALMEEFVPGRTENLHDYLIPPSATSAHRDLDRRSARPHGPYGAKGLGEHALIPTAPAILNAIHDATGVRIRRLPATPAPGPPPR